MYVYVSMTGNVFGSGFGGNGSLDQMLTGRKRVCGVGGLKQSGSVVGDHWDSENEPRGRRLFGSGNRSAVRKLPARLPLSLQCRDPQCWSSGRGSP